MADPFAAIEAKQEERKKDQFSTANSGSSTTAKLSKLRGKLFAKHPRPDSDDEAAREADSSAPSQLLSSSRQLRTQQDEVDDFLHGSPAIPAPVVGPRRNLSLLAPRLNLAAARDAGYNTTSDERWQPTKPRRCEGLTVSFDISQVLIIGVGGEDAREPVATMRRGQYVQSSPHVDAEAGEMTGTQSTLDGINSTTISISKDHSTVRPSTGYRQNEDNSGSSPSSQHLSYTHGKPQKKPIVGEQAEMRSLRHLRAEEGLTFRSALGPPSEDEGIPRPSSSNSSGLERDHLDRSLATTAALEPQNFGAGSMPLHSRPSAVQTTDGVPLQVVARDATYLTPPSSQGHIDQPREQSKWHVEQFTPPSMTRKVVHPPRVSSKPSPVQCEAPRHEKPATREGANTRDYTHLPVRRHDNFPKLQAFGVLVAHLATIFNARASTENSIPTRSDWARAATWWFLRARGGLEELVRSTISPQDASGLSLLKAHLINLSKVWWIMVNVLPTLPENSVSAALEKTRHNLALSFEALLQSMEKRDLFPTQSLEIVSGLDTSIWTSEPVSLDTREAQALRHWFPVASLVPASTEDMNAFPNLPIVEPLHHFVYLRGFAPAILTNITGPEVPPDTFPVLLTIIRSKDSFRPGIILTTQCGSVDLAATLVSNSQPAAGVPRSDPAHGLPSAICDPRSSSVAISLPRLADHKEQRVIQVFPRPVDFSKLNSLIKTCTRSVGSSMPVQYERDLLHAPLSQCQVTYATSNGSQFSIQSSMIHIFGEFETHDDSQPNASGEVAFGGNQGVDTHESARPRAHTGVGADKHRSPRHLGASLLNKGLNTLRARSRSRSEPATAEQSRSGTHERAEAVDASTGWNDKTGETDGATSSEGGHLRITRLGVVTDRAGRRVDSMELTIGGVDGWYIEGIKSGVTAGDTSGVEQTYALRFVATMPASKRADFEQHGDDHSAQTSTQRQEWVCVLIEKRQRDETMRILQSLQ